jgi:flagellar protein FlbT
MNHILRDATEPPPAIEATPRGQGRRDGRGEGRGQGRLILDLRAGESLMVNGAELVMRSRGSVMLCNRARFLFGRQVLDPADATTPARRLYLALQLAYAGEDAARPAHAAEARRLAETQLETRGPRGCALLHALLAELALDRVREALSLARELFAEDDAPDAA